MGEANAASPRKNLGIFRLAVAGDHRQQHPPPELGAVVVAPPEHHPLQVAELVEHEQGMVAGAAEVAVVGRALLLAVGLADRAVHVEDDPGQLAMPVRAEACIPALG